MTIEQEIKLQVEARTKERLNEKLNEKLDESKLEIAKNLLKINISPEQIAMATGLPLEQVTKLKTGEIYVFYYSFKTKTPVF